jgi:hypothetical protein
MMINSFAIRERIKAIILLKLSFFYAFFENAMLEGLKSTGEKHTP